LTAPAARLAGAAAVAILLAGAAPPPTPRDAAMPAILPLRERARVEDRWLAERLDRLVPMLMRRDGVAMWILIAGEYHEDPVAATMLPATWLSARRRTILVFFDRGADKGVERIALARYPVGSFASAWDPDRQKDQWARLAEIVRERDPGTIAVNRAAEFPLADGLTASHAEALSKALGPDYAARLVSHDRLALGWLETRIPAEIDAYPTLSRISHAIIDEGFSDRVITPGVTTPEDVMWWYREKIAALGLGTWFHPSVDIQRMGQAGELRGDTPILPGDVLHVDFGITYLGLNTDVQRMAYMLRPGETAAPKGLREGLAAMIAVRDATTAALRTGQTGNEVLAAARRRLAAGGIDGTIYSHAIGYHGHGAGPWIGAWEDQGGVPFRGAYPVHPDTAWSIELNARHRVPEWGGQAVRFFHEEDGYHDGRTFRFFDGVQDEMILIPRLGASPQAR
jgi:Xaa-Pro aminopeptidase